MPTLEKGTIIMMMRNDLEWMITMANHRTRRSKRKATKDNDARLSNCDASVSRLTHSNQLVGVFIAVVKCLIGILDMTLGNR